MKKILLTIFLILNLASNVSAGTAEFYHEYLEDDEVNYLRLNGNIRNILNILNGGLDNVNPSANFNFIEIVDALPLAGDEGRAVYLTTSNTFNFDDGTDWVEVPTYAGSAVIGDTLYFGGTVWTRLAIGATGNTLNISGGIPSWSSLNLAGGANYITGILPIANVNTTTLVVDGDAAGGDLTGTYPNPTLAIPIVKCFSDVVEDETNKTLLVGTFTNKWVIFSGYFFSGSQVDCDKRIPAGANDNETLGETWRVAGEAVTPIFGYAGISDADMTSDAISTFFGRFYTESGISAPAVDATFDVATPLGLCALNADAANVYSKDCFLYVDSTTFDLMLHIGTNTQDYVGFSVFIIIVPNTDF